MSNFVTTATLIGMVQAFQPDDSHVTVPLFPEARTLSNTYEFDIVEGNRNKADYKLPDGEAGVQANTKRSRKTIVLPTLREKKTLKESTLRWLDGAGKKAPESALDAISREMQDLDAIIERTHEYARWKLLMTGAITLTGDYDDTYDFGLENEADAAVPWSTIATSDPIGDLILWRNMIQKASGIRPTDIWLSSIAVKYIFESTKALLVLGEATKDRYAETGSVLKLADMNVTVFDGGYRDSSDAFKYYMSDDGVAGNMALIKTPGTVGVTAQGSVVDADAPPGLVGKFAKSWVTQDPSARWILEAQTCLPGLTNINNFGAFTLWD